MVHLLPIQCAKEARRVVDAFTVERYGERVVRLPSGRPTIKSCCISISHTANVVAIITNDTRCGVDIELSNRNVEHVASRFTTSDELDIAQKTFANNPPLLIWCAKEATYKWGERQEVDFLRDMQLIAADGDKLTMRFFDQTLTLRWYIDNHLLILHTI